MAEQRNFDTGQPGVGGDTGKQLSDIDASETESNQDVEITSHAGSNPEASSTTSAAGAYGASSSQPAIGAKSSPADVSGSPMSASPTSGWETSGSQASSSQATGSAKETFERQKQEAIEKGREFQESARQTAESVKHKAADMAHEAKATARDMSDRAMHSAAETAQQMQQQCVSFADEQKSRVASELSTFSDALGRAADTLRENQDQRVASYADMAAEQLRSTADYLQSCDVSDLMSDVENFARRRPEVFFGGMLLVGLGIARFLKASSRSSSRREYGEPQGYASLERNRGFVEPDYDDYDEPSYDELSYAETDYETPSDLGAGASPQGTQRGPMNDPLSYH